MYIRIDLAQGMTEETGRNLATQVADFISSIGEQSRMIVVSICETPPQRKKP